MGDVNAGQIKWLVFFIVFLSIFSLLGYTFTTTATGVITPYVAGSIGNISPQDIGTSGFIDVTGGYMTYNGGQTNFDLGSVNILKIAFAWGGGAPYALKWQMGILNSWWIFPTGLSETYGGFMNASAFTQSTNTNNTASGNPEYRQMSGVYSTKSFITNAMIIQHWDSTMNYTKLVCTIDPAVGGGGSKAGSIWYLFIQDSSNDPIAGRNNITQAIAAGQVYVAFARQSAPPDAGNILGFISWIFTIVTFQSTFGLSNIPVFNVLILILVGGTLLSLISIIKSLVTGWI